MNLVQIPRVLARAQRRRSVSYRGRDPRTVDAPILQDTSTPRNRTRTLGVAGQGTGTVVDSIARGDTRWLSSRVHAPFTLVVAKATTRS
jgi:hypothetical protein